MDKVRDIMTQDPAYCLPETGLRDVADMMRDFDCGEIPVVESRQSPKPIGVITDRDIVCRTIAESENPLKLRAEDCMTIPCVVVEPETSVEACIELLQRHKIRRVAVVDKAGLCIGMVSLADLALKTNHDRTAELLKEVSREA